jgi:hypothetical protein
MGYVRLRPRPWPVKQDEEARDRFRSELARLKEEGVEIWFSDECGVQGDPKPRRVIAKKGSHPTLSFTETHIKENVVGAVRISNGKFVSLVMPFMDTMIFQTFLDEMQKWIGDKRVIMIVDNATWHKAGRLNWGRIEPMYLPPYSPDLNPIERIWLSLKNNFFTNFVALDWTELQTHLVEALRFYHFDQNVCKSICGS